MNRNKKTGVRVRGFMCQSAATASSVCMPIDSAVVPIRRRPPFLLPHNHLCRNAGVSNGYHNDNKRLISERSTNFLPASSSSFIKRQQPQPQDLPVLDPKPKPRPFIQPSLPLASPDQVFQVVVMRVSLHCQGCAGKLKKHLSKMEGVTSFSIDLETKRVTVMGHVSPTAVLESISTVKRAEFWPC